MPIAFYPTRGNYVGIEVGMAHIADPRNQFGNGPGKTAVLGIRNWEIRAYERYEQGNRSDPDTFGDAQGARARFSITSVGRRLLFPTGIPAVALRALIGGAWVRRDSYRNDPDSLLTTTGLAMRPQHGLAAMVGGGVQIGPFTAEMRAYPAVWTDISGDSRSEIEGPEPSSQMESPGGIPVTLTAGFGFFF